ncbi:DNA polymerase IV [Salinifilum ghardaiensis]
MERVVLHVDLDQFIVAVELLRHPQLRGRPVLVGGTGDPTRRGVVAGASYEAREHGVRSGTPLRTAAARCPQAVFLPADSDHYQEASTEVMAVLRSWGGRLEQTGWDEAFLLVDTAEAESAARELQRRVRERTGLACSVGIGDNKLRAKIASGLAKPENVHRLDVHNWVAVMADRPCDALHGIGSKTSRRLAERGIGTVAELARADRGELAAAFGPSIGPWLVALAHGFDSSPVTDTPPPPRSHGREVTFDTDLDDRDRVRTEVRRLAATLSGELEQDGLRPRRVVVKIRDDRFRTHTHGRGVRAATAEAITEAALTALGEFPLDRPVRLVGVRAELE